MRGETAIATILHEMSHVLSLYGHLDEIFAGRFEYKPVDEEVQVFNREIQVLKNLVQGQELQQIAPEVWLDCSSSCQAPSRRNNSVLPS
jgi:hypothetical protein